MVCFREFREPLSQRDKDSGFQKYGKLPLRRDFPGVGTTAVLLSLVCLRIDVLVSLFDERLDLDSDVDSAWCSYDRPFSGGTSGDTSGPRDFVK